MMMMKFLPVVSIYAIAIFVSSCGETPKETYDSPINYSHSFMAWDCPDNLAFPRIDLKDWQKVPVVNGRLPTYEEAQNGTSLLYIDKEMKPELKDVEPYKMTLPKLAYFTNPRTHEKEIMIVIQLVQFKDYVWAGLRYVSGGNASAVMSDLEFLTDEQVKQEIANSQLPKDNGELNNPRGY
jgi:hypothetical protein